MVILYKKWKKYNEFQLTKNKMDLNIRKMTNHPPSPEVLNIKQINSTKLNHRRCAMPLSSYDTDPCPSVTELLKQLKPLSNQCFQSVEPTLTTLSQGANQSIYPHSSSIIYFFPVCKHRRSVKDYSQHLPGYLEKNMLPKKCSRKRQIP